MRIKWKLFVASSKMYTRQREALIWNILLPLFMIFLFGFVNFGGVGRLNVGVVNEAGHPADSVLASMERIQTLKLSRGEREAELHQLEIGERDLVVVFPSSFQAEGGGEFLVYSNDGKPRETELGTLILQRVFDEMILAKTPGEHRLHVVAKPVKSRNLTYIDFLIPGILSMSIMQTGIFGVSFGFVSLKKRGILRRLWVTPINPTDFIIAQVVTRLIVLMVQVVVMVGFGLLFFHLHFIGSLLDMFVLSLLGGVVFLSVGFAIAGVSKSEDQVAPLANLITLPMLLLGGIFFSRSNLPGFIHVVTDFFPLTYLADGLRSIAIYGATLGGVTPQLMGLGVWSVIGVFIAVKMFRWE